MCFFVVQVSFNFAFPTDRYPPWSGIFRQDDCEGTMALVLAQKKKVWDDPDPFLKTMFGPKPIPQSVKGFFEMVILIFQTFTYGLLQIVYKCLRY